MDEKIVGEILEDVYDELYEATLKNGSFPTAHHGYGVIQEEVDELWDEIKKKVSKRDTANMRKECIQIAAMAVRFIMDLLPDSETLH